MYKTILILICIFILICIYLSHNINTLEIAQYTIKNKKIPKEFDGYNIVQISDLHSKSFGKNNIKLLQKIKSLNPDIIVITGDLIDSNNTNIDVAMDLINGAINIAPIYYVSGNHEAWSGSYNDLKSKLENSGVVVLDNRKIQVFNDNDSIDIIG